MYQDSRFKAGEKHRKTFKTHLNRNNPTAWQGSTNINQLWFQQFQRFQRFHSQEWLQADGNPVFSTRRGSELVLYGFTHAPVFTGIHMHIALCVKRETDRYYIYMHIYII